MNNDLVNEKLENLFKFFVFVPECGGGVSNDNVRSCTGGGGGSASDSGDQMDADARAKELARRKEEAKRKRRKKKRTGSSLVTSCFQGIFNDVIY